MQHQDDTAFWDFLRWMHQEKLELYTIYKVADRVYRNICAKYALDVSRSKWDIPPRVVESDWPKIL